jgi:hypothetical protein
MRDKNSHCTNKKPDIQKDCEFLKLTEVGSVLKLEIVSLCGLGLLSRDYYTARSCLVNVESVACLFIALGK